MENGNLNEIKKILYKEKPIAHRFGPYNPNDKEWLFMTETSLGQVFFKVPVSDMGEKIFNREEPAQLLIRWIELR